ncbi:Hpt domain-containing protein [Loktanella sp. SALINAS62]|uniref:Hpt domain-containing protein n=1 Tax=Loktanella sp. SALINAS62 TaxID=2706124 RepID=UPI001B8C29DF|nr:Hpt domain-containing protein [Loktanella sp. SALINAS62]MBS1303884.1 hypothetical protein [Loktanella sp. SALINAS62]
MNEAAPGTLVAAIDRLRIRFLDQYNAQHAQLIQLGLQLGEAGDDRDRTQQAKHILHRVAGTAGTLGLKRLGQAATRGEERLHQILGQDSIDNNAARRAIVAFLEVSADFVTA